MATIYQFKMSGRTQASVDGTATGIISTFAVAVDSDGWLRFNDATGNPQAIEISSASGGMAALIDLLFRASGGFDLGSAGVQGHRIFSSPRAIQ